MGLNEIYFPTCVENIFIFDLGDELGVILFLKIASAFGEIITWDDLVYDITLSYMDYYVLLDVKGDMCFSKYRTIDDLQVWLLTHHGSFYSLFCQCFLCRQVSLVLLGYKPFVANFDA